jgi:hypothetical protein
MRPGLALAGLRLSLPASTHRASRVDPSLLCAHAIANTPVSLCGARIARFPRSRRPSLVSHQLGVHITLFEACSAFTHVMACALADRLFSDLLLRRLRPQQLPATSAPVASGWSDSCRVGYPPPTGVMRPFHGARESSASPNTVHVTVGYIRIAGTRLLVGPRDLRIG